MTKSILQQIEALAESKGGRLIAATLYQQKGNLHICLVRLAELEEKDYIRYVVWEYSQWKDEGFFGQGDYFPEHLGNALPDAFARYVERSQKNLVYLADEFEREAELRTNQQTVGS